MVKGWWNSMSMRKSMSDIYKIFINDETLLRLLYYPPKNLATNTPDPLSPTLTNILDMPLDEKWAIIDDRILLTPKTDDLTTPKCRLLFYAGRRTTTSNYYYANQEIICDILVHFDYEKDQRSMWISDRINELLVRERITGIGKMDYIGGGQIRAVDNYVGYQNKYEFGSGKK
jgi:hypothetical protein